jgi:hypothetical protein
MAEGLFGYLAISAQQSFGTATQSNEFVPFNSEALTTEVEPLTESGIRNRLGEPPTHEGLETVAGDLVIEPDFTNIGHFIKGVFGQSVSSTTGAGSGTQYDHTFTPLVSADFDEKSSLPPYTVTIHRDVTSAFRFTDTVFNTLALTITAGQLTEMTVGTMAKATSIVSMGASSYANSAFISTWDVASISIGGAANAIMENVTINFDNQIEGVPFLDNTKTIGKFKRTGWQLVRVSGTIDFESLSEYNEFKTQSERALFITLDDSNVVSLNNLTIDIPKLRYETFPINVGGPERVSVDFTARGIYEVNSNYAIQIVLVNSRSQGY